MRTTAMDAVGDALTTHVATVLSWTVPAGSVVVQVVDVTLVNGTVGVGLGRRRLPPGTLGPDSPVCLVRYCLLSAFGAGVVESMAAALRCVWVRGVGEGRGGLSCAVRCLGQLWAVAVVVFVGMVPRA